MGEAVKLTKARDAAIRKMVHGHTDLNTFHAVIQMMEGGLLYDPGSQRAANQIIRICKAEGDRLLRLHDQGRASLEGVGQ